MERLCPHDAESAESFLTRWEGPVYRLARRWLRNDADAADATQEIFLVLLRDRRQIREPERESAWVTIASRRILNHFRARRQRRQDVERASSRRRSVVAAPIEDPDRDLVVRDSVAALPEELRSAIELHFFMGLSQREAAAALNLPRTTIQSRINKGLDRLRPKLASGAGAAAPDLGAWLRGPDLPPPSSLRAQLLSKLGETPALTEVLVQGGIIMKIKTGAVLALVTALSVIGGVATGQLVAPASPASESEAPPALVTTEETPEAPAAARAAAKRSDDARALRAESAALKAQLVEAERALAAIDEAERAKPVAAPTPATPERAANEPYALAGELIVMLGELEAARKVSRQEADKVRRRYFQERPGFIQAVFKNPEAITAAMIRRLKAGDPEVDDALHIACIDSTFSVPVSDPLLAEIFDHMASVLESPSSSTWLKKSMIRQYMNHGSDRGSARFQALAKVGRRLEDAALLEAAGRSLEILGRQAKEEDSAGLLRDRTAPDPLRAAALRALSAWDLKGREALIFDAIESGGPELRASAYHSLGALAPSVQARRLLEAGLQGADFYVAAAAEEALLKHGDTGTVQTLKAVGADAKRPEDLRLLARHLASQLEAALAGQGAGR